MFSLQFSQEREVNERMEGLPFCIVKRFVKRVKPVCIAKLSLEKNTNVHGGVAKIYGRKHILIISLFFIKR